MNELEERREHILKRIFLHSPVRYIVSLIICVTIAIVYVAFQNGWTLLFSWGNGITAGGAIMILIGLLVLVSQFGAFDIFGYAFSSLRGQKRKYHDLYEYSENKNVERKKTVYYFVPYIVVGIIVLIIGIILTYVVK